MTQERSGNLPAVTRPSAALQVTRESIAETQAQIALLENMVRTALKPGVDYGLIPGTPQPSLWDPGAAKIINCFNCRVGQRRIISLREDSEMISIILEIPLLHRMSGLEMDSGIGAASTLETKYKRWVDSPSDWGYDAKATKAFKTRKNPKTNQLEYRIPNPEHGDLLNTLVKIASKRGEVDAAQRLPGVASVLREMFSGGPRGPAPSQPGCPQGPRQERPKEENEWDRFWGKTRQMGYKDSNQVHNALRVTSMKQWLESKSLDDAIRELAMLIGKDSDELWPPTTKDSPDSE